MFHPFHKKIVQRMTKTQTMKMISMASFITNNCKLSLEPKRRLLCSPQKAAEYFHTKAL